MKKRSGGACRWRMGTRGGGGGRNAGATQQLRQPQTSRRSSALEGSSSVGEGRERKMVSSGGQPVSRMGPDIGYRRKGGEGGTQRVLRCSLAWTGQEGEGHWEKERGRARKQLWKEPIGRMGGSQDK